MIEALSVIFGGLLRLGQHVLDLKEKDRERQHELNMFDRTTAAAKDMRAHESAMKQMAGEQADVAAEWSAMEKAVVAQAEEAKAAGGIIAKFSAAMRPLITFYHVILLYTVNKSASLYIVLASNVPLATAILHVNTEFDKALVGSIVSYWFVDRGLRKLR